MSCRQFDLQIGRCAASLVSVEGVQTRVRIEAYTRTTMQALLTSVPQGHAAQESRPLRPAPPSIIASLGPHPSPPRR